MQSKSRRSRYIAVAGAVLTLLAALVWALLGLSPRAYEPIEAANPQEVSPYLTHHLGPDFYNQVQLDRPFDLVVDQPGLNDILSREDWPQQYGDVTVGIPVAVFEAGTLHVMSRVGYFGLSAILTVTAKPFMDDRGGLNVNIQAVRLGLVPVTSLAARIAKQCVDNQAAEFADWPQVEMIVRAVVSNTSFEPVFDFDQQQFCIRQVSVTPGQLILRFAPASKTAQK